MVNARQSCSQVWHGTPGLLVLINHNIKWRCLIPDVVFTLATGVNLHQFTMFQKPYSMRCPQMISLKQHKVGSKTTTTL